VPPKATVIVSSPLWETEDHAAVGPQWTRVMMNIRLVRLTVNWRACCITDPC
jgi:hypothetical protein